MNRRVFVNSSLYCTFSHLYYKLPPRFINIFLAYTCTLGNAVFSQIPPDLA